MKFKKFLDYLFYNVARCTKGEHMRKRIYIIIMSIVIIFSLKESVFANDDITNTFDMLDTTSLNTLTTTENFSFEELFNDLINGKIEFSFIAIVNYIINKTFSEMFLNIALIRNLILITILSAFFSNISSSFKSTDTQTLAFYSFYIAIVTILYNSFYLAYQVCFDLINSIYNFTIASVPLISTSILLSGNPAFLTAFNPLLWFFTQTFIVIIRTILLPFILCVASLDIINRINDKEILSNFCKTGKQVISWSLKVSSGLFISFLTVMRITTPIYDGLITKTAKIGISAVPIVGNSLSQALDTALYLGKTTKNGALVALLIALVIYISIYFIKLFSFMMIYKISAIAIEPIADKKISKSISVVGDYVGYFIATCFFISLMFIFSILTIISL